MMVLDGDGVGNSGGNDGNGGSVLSLPGLSFLFSPELVKLYPHLAI